MPGQPVDGAAGLTHESVTVAAVPETDLPGPSYADGAWYGEASSVSNSLHEAIVRARELSSQTRNVLSESADTVRRAGQTRRRRE